MTEAELMAVDDAAHQYGLHRDTIFKWLREGRLRRYKRGGDRRTFVNRVELEHLTQFKTVNDGRD